MDTRLSRRFRFALIVGVLVCAVWGARSTFQWMFAPPTYSVKADLDCVWLMSGIEPTRTFGETLHWWTGPWCYDLVPYYRPLTSLFFWWEYRAFGPNGIQGFTAVHLVSHLLFASLALCFLARLMGWWRASAAVAIWGLGAAAFYDLGTPIAAFPFWKDSCDIWCATAYVGSLYCLLRFLRERRRGFAFASFALFLLSLTFKEMGYTLPFMAALLAWRERKLKTEWRAIAGLFALAVLALLYRTWALDGFGYKNGTNGAWLSRTLVVLGGEPARTLVCGDPFPYAMVGAVMAGWFASKKRWRWAAASLSIAVVAYASTAWLLHVGLDEPVFKLFASATWTGAAWMGSFLWLLWRFVARRDRDQLFGYGWVAVAQIPLMSMPVGDHGHYLVGLGWGIWLACAAEDIWQVAASSRSANRRHSRRKAAAAPGAAAALSEH